ncbi:ankyrin repeat domain-containing protein [Terriglobus albidus]|uniref:ankyrin repeat domain-containing protein n=1 Tax=Terriglobus albidus TaxID=1592106 RepID=UPI0021DFB9A6|nr:ankyrin repeat domain-containing protein [Terriglobus albidus]
MGSFDDLLEAAKRGDEDEVRTIVSHHPELLHQRDERGATVLHHAAFGGHHAIAEFLVHQGAEINARDAEFGATPAGWAIEYLREMGGFLAIELDDLAFAIERRDAIWVARLIRRFPALRRANNSEGTPLSQLAEQTGDPRITRLFQRTEHTDE